MPTKRTSAAAKPQTKKASTTSPARVTVTLPAFPVPAVLDALRTFWRAGCPGMNGRKADTKAVRNPRVAWLDALTAGADLAAVTGRANRDAALRRAALDALAAEGHTVRLDVTDEGAAPSLDTLNKTHHGNTAGVSGYLADAVAHVLDAGNPKEVTKAGEPKAWPVAERRAVEAWLDTVTALFRTAPGDTGGPSTRPRAMYIADGARVFVVALDPNGYDPLAPTA